MAELRLREDQKGIVMKIIDALRGSGFAALQAPTGWSKTVTALFAIEELKVKLTLWFEPRFEPRLATELHVFQHAISLGLRALATAGREKLCLHGYSNIDFP